MFFVFVFFCSNIQNMQSTFLLTVVILMDRLFRLLSLTTLDGCPFFFSFAGGWEDEARQARRRQYCLGEGTGTLRHDALTGQDSHQDQILLEYTKYRFWCVWWFLTAVISRHTLFRISLLPIKACRSTWVYWSIVFFYSAIYFIYLVYTWCLFSHSCILLVRSVFMCPYPIN